MANVKNLRIIMNSTELDNSMHIIEQLIAMHDSMRAAARYIGEDSSDLQKWRYGKSYIQTRAIISICRLYPHIKPSELNPDIFPADVSLVFDKTKVAK